MRPSDDSILSPDERRAEVAHILTSGILRLHARAALPEESMSENPPKDAPSCLEVPEETVLSVHRG